MSSPFLEPSNVYMCTLQPTRLITTEEFTEADTAIVARYWAHLPDSTSRGVLIFGGPYPAHARGLLRERWAAQSGRLLTIGN